MNVDILSSRNGRWSGSRNGRWSRSRSRSGRSIIVIGSVSVITSIVLCRICDSIIVGVVCVSCILSCVSVISDNGVVNCGVAGVVISCTINCTCICCCIICRGCI